MKIIIVDDEVLAVDSMKGLLAQMDLAADIESFTEAEDAFEYLLKNKADIAFLDIEMGEWSGIGLAEKCKELCPRINIIFVTAYAQYTMDALKLHASGYLLKPIQEEALRTELDNLRFPLLFADMKKVKIQTFGHFEIFVNGRFLDLPRAKCRECLAYLVDRKGARVSMSELATILWEDKPYDRTMQNRTYQVVFILMKTLREAGIEDIIIRNRKEMAIDPTKIECDYYAMLEGDSAALKAFNGEYMSNYSWAEMSLSQLVAKKG